MNQDTKIHYIRSMAYFVKDLYRTKHNILNQFNLYKASWYTNARSKSDIEWPCEVTIENGKVTVLLTLNQ